MFYNRNKRMRASKLINEMSQLFINIIEYVIMWLKKQMRQLFTGAFSWTKKNVVQILDIARIFEG